MDQLIFVDKPAGMSSFGAVARVRRILSEKAGKKVKVGHTGTLDPFATGLLILLAGKATKRAPEFLKLDKVYEATIYLGKSSTTGDPEGEITSTAPNAEAGSDSALVSNISKQHILDTLQSFTGKITQTPPIFSAIKINGERAYRLARKGEKVAIPTREVEVYSIELLDFSLPLIKIRTHVGSGTYIRSLAVDIGKALGCGAYLTALRRTKIADYDLADLPLFPLPE
ncbi:tRNA pseudouridine(55) synthase TruB [Candidatus Saccharibacteria bacterium]|nr:tRNA pseudouridine(55) synthase TruB [Candidatus Saccharibacteria bacterium]